MSIEFPYNIFGTYPHEVKTWDEVTIESAFKNRKVTSIDDAFKLITDEKLFSVVLNTHFSLGAGNNKDKPIIWFDEVPIAEVSENAIALYSSAFEQELRDFFKLTNDYKRAITISVPAKN